jgi:hypothetical protein
MNRRAVIRQMTTGQVQLRRLILAVGLVLLLTGLLRGEARLVLLRAIQICLGCIGIG